MIFTAKEETQLFSLAALRLFDEKPRLGHRLSTAVLHQGIGTINSNTTTGIAASLYDFRGGPRCTGKERDGETGLDYFETRYFSGAQGRFTSPDSYDIMQEMRKGKDEAEQRQILNNYLSNPQEWNKYTYALNNPLKNIDPDGRNACGANDDATCKVTVTIQDRTKDKSGNYNDQFSGTKGSQNFNATATVTVNGQVTGSFLVRTVPSGPQFATIENGTYQGFFHYKNEDRSKPTIELTSHGSAQIPTLGPNRAQGGEFFATGVLLHSAGRVSDSNPLGYTGMLPGNHGVSEASSSSVVPDIRHF